MKKNYEEKTLRKLQKLELMIFKDFIDLCKRHNLNYFAFGGTAIGALRHKGFIPWDDDIDVCLVRSEYNQFLKYAKEELSDKYLIMNAEENLNYPLFTTRLILKGTVFREKEFKGLDCPLGIFLDIFAFDNIPDDDKKYHDQGRKVWFYSKLFMLRNIKIPVIQGSKPKVFIIKTACACIHYVLKFCLISKKYLYRKTMHYLTMYNNETTTRTAYLTDVTPYINTINYKDLFPTILLDFEDIKVAFPNNMHQMMTDQYGDYMSLPPVNKRKNHYPYSLDFGEYDD